MAQEAQEAQEAHLLDLGGMVATVLLLWDLLLGFMGHPQDLLLVNMALLQALLPGHTASSSRRLGPSGPLKALHQDR